MPYLIINGKKELIPPFPHHKNYIYRCRQFFLAKGLKTHLTMDRFITIKELYRGWKHKCTIPRSLLIDPTSQCNLRCKGCWAADYASRDNISYDKLDDILSQSEELGIQDCIMSGGEPLMRKADIIRLCEKHRKTSFGFFTNGTLIDEAFANKMAELQNMTAFLSIEGYRDDTDFRRGSGTFDRVMNAMALLKGHSLAFGFSMCYHSKNYETICSDAFLDMLRDNGCWFGWMFNYVPIGSGADMSLVLNAQQRAYVRNKITDYCERNDFVIIDFWNNGHQAFGCVGAGNGFVHINAKGDVEPCAFCHYSDSNIYEKSLLESLRSPFFKAFRRAQPFSENPLKSCPMVDQPHRIVELVNQSGAISTHFAIPEPPEKLAEKLDRTAKEWNPVADQLYSSLPAHTRKNFSRFLKYHKLRKSYTDLRGKQK